MYACSGGLVNDANMPFHITNVAKYSFAYRYLFVKTHNDLLQKQDIYAVRLYHFCFGRPGEYREVAVLAGYQGQCIPLIMHKLRCGKMAGAAYAGRM